MHPTAHPARNAQYEYEWYPTPRPFIRWLGRHLPPSRYETTPVYAEPCVGDSVICAVLKHADWITNDLNPQWAADTHLDAAGPAYWDRLPPSVEGIITNPAYSIAMPILQWAMTLPQLPLIALHVRLSFLEPLKTDARQRQTLRDFPPSTILPLPRFPYQRNKKGEWAQDTMTSCWAIWNPISDEWESRTTRIIMPSEQLMQETAKAAAARRRDLPEMDT